MKDGPVKIIHVINRLEAIDRDLTELRSLKRNLAKNRAYYSDMSIAFDRQINTLLNERIKLMELRIENPPENLVNREWMEQMDQYEPVDERELQSPDAHGPVVSQDRADEIVAGLKSKAGRKKEPKLTVVKDKPAPKPVPKAAVKPQPKPAPPSDNGADGDDDDIQTFKF